MTTRILQLLLAPAIGGAETLAAGLQNGLADHGFVVRTAYLDPAGTSSSPIARVLRLAALVRSERPDLVLAHSALPNLYARLVIRRRPVVTVLHSASRDFDNPALRRAERLLRRRTAGVVAVSRPQLEEYEAAFGHAVPVQLIPNGVASGLPSKSARRPGARTVRVVTLARINTQKDPATWRSGALLAVSARPDLTFAWFGPRSTDLEQQALVENAGHPSVLWSGPTRDSGAALAAADIYFHAARAEAHPLAPLEAAAVGLPIVCSESVAASLPPGLPAATFATADAESAAAAVLRVVERLDEATRHAAEWQPRVRLEYGLDRVCLAYSVALRRALGTAPAPTQVATPIG
jgi:L-malate glycosyltransferase